MAGKKYLWKDVKEEHIVNVILYSQLDIIRFPSLTLDVVERQQLTKIHFTERWWVIQVCLPFFLIIQSCHFIG